MDGWLVETGYIMPGVYEIYTVYHQEENTAT